MHRQALLTGATALGEPVAAVNSNVGHTWLGGVNSWALAALLQLPIVQEQRRASYPVAVGLCARLSFALAPDSDVPAQC